MVEKWDTYKVKIDILGKEKQMIEQTTKLTCDKCGDFRMSGPKIDPYFAWTQKTEVGDLCPSCLAEWEKHKEKFLNEKRDI